MTGVYQNEFFLHGWASAKRNGVHGEGQGDVGGVNIPTFAFMEDSCLRSLFRNSLFSLNVSNMV